jgi:ABC-type cobalamin/Fe3+-siderophores transport system ATPase subunit
VPAAVIDGTPHATLRWHRCDSYLAIATLIAMQFAVIPAKQRPPMGSAGIFLERNNWDDYSFRTLFQMYYSADGNQYISIGSVKIAHLGMNDGGITPIPDRFEELPHTYFSLGQDVSYYEALKALGTDIREAVLRALRDTAFDLELFRRLQLHNAMRTSLLRGQVEATVTGQYHRIATGGRKLVDQRFSYVARDGLTLRFEAIPGSQPPTNVHVLIGSNGVGKTQLLNDLARAAVRPADSANMGSIYDLQQETGRLFANIISISFSAFDLLRPVASANDIRYDHVTLDRTHNPNGRTPARQFADVVRSLVGERRFRWHNALETLGTDPLLQDALAALTSIEDVPSSERIAAVFDALSSGHKIVTLAISYLADLLTESTLVLIDEPETHLHPPLLASFVRVLSDLLIDRNGVAIIATHSPVVLQETPRTCVWKLHRVGEQRTAVQPELETFGENVGTLTREAFGLEITRSGFHRRLAEAVSDNLTYEAILEQFHGQLGTEAKAIVRALIATRNRGSH